MKIFNEFYKKLFFLSVPIIIRTTVSSFSGFIDNLMVGQLGVNSISAVSIINNILFVFICTITGTIAGASIFSTQYFGIKDYNGVKKVFHIKFILFIIVFFLYFLFVHFFYDKLISLFMTQGQQEIKNEIMGLCDEYLFYAFLSLIPFGINTVFSTTISESGNTFKPMIICLSCTALNTLLNYCFINGNFGFHAMGIHGAAFATFISRLIEMICMIVISIKTDFFKKFFNKIEIDITLLKDILKKAIPLAIDDFLFSFSFVVGIQIYSLQNINNITIISIASIINAFFINLIVSLSIAAEIILGHELGQNNLEKANDYAHKVIKITIISSVILSIFIYLLSLYVPYFYNIENNLQYCAERCIQMYAYSFIVTALSCVIFFILRSGGNTLLLSLIDGVFIWLIELPLCYLLIKFSSLNLPIIYLLVLLSAIIKVLVGFIFIKRKIWLNKLVNK